MPRDEYTSDPPMLRHLQVLAALLSWPVFVAAVAMSREGVMVFLGQARDPYEGRALFVALCAGLPMAVAGLAFALYGFFGANSTVLARVAASLPILLNAAIPLGWGVLWLFFR